MLGREIRDKAQMEKGALDLIQMDPQAVVVKGGHLSDDCDGCLCLENPNLEIHQLSTLRIQTQNTHGTGCAFSAAITAFLTRGFTILDSVNQAKEYLAETIDTGRQLKIGQGNGSVHHFYHLLNFPPHQEEGE
ncbi:MAG: bifunctional hydroxymethylpyrimidine kinase/phosphomethylpyrimidine kinase [Candidatus Neptunochlamydia sp.]|nr:bifunctional hydroxymethylpyrimidine kinase/phosphomethylpyrimidine kinase [Candidatus Neptunochlamydia sp.]